MTYKNMHQAILECKKGSVYYWYTNIDFAKRTVFLLHGLTANHAMFDKQIEFLSDKYNVIVWDAPALGGYIAQSFISRYPEMVSDYGKADLCHLMGIGYAGLLDDNKELQIHCPLLLLVGEKDNTGKVKQYNKEWSKRTGIDITWIPNAAHNSNVDNPNFVNHCIEEFLVGL